MSKYGLIIISCIFLLLGCEDKSTKEESVRFVKSAQLGDIKTQREKNYPAIVSATQKVELAFQVPGQLIKFPVAKGQVVVMGDVLAELDPRDYQHTLDEKKALLEQTTKDYARFQELLRTNSIAKVRVDAKKADFKVAKAQAARAQKSFDDTKLKAPFDGIVADKFVENFENIKAKQPIVNLQDISFVEFIINAPEQDVFHIDDITEVSADKLGPIIGNIRLESLPNKSFPVHLKEYATEADPNTQTYEITLTMENPDNINIFPGMTATFIPEITSETKDTYLVPVTAVFPGENNQNYIWVISDDGTVKKIPVEVGPMENDYIQIHTSEKKGTSIVTAGTAYIQEGMKVITQQPKD